MYSALTSEIFVRSDSKIVGVDSEYIALIQKLTIYLYPFLRYRAHKFYADGRTAGRTDGHGLIDFSILPDQEYIYMSIPKSDISNTYKHRTKLVYPFSLWKWI